MLRCATSFVSAAYPKGRRIPLDLRALPAIFLQSRLILTFYEFINIVFCISGVACQNIRSCSFYDV